jgi:hypothetical protein
MRKEHKTIEAIILILVLLTAATGLYYMYAVSTGRAFLQVTVTVQQTGLEFCCCAPVANEKHLFTVFGQITKDASPEQKTASCSKICGEHGSAAHPTKLLHTKKCGGL